MQITEMIIKFKFKEFVFKLFKCLNMVWIHILKHFKFNFDSTCDMPWARPTANVGCSVPPPRTAISRATCRTPFVSFVRVACLFVSLRQIVPPRRPTQLHLPGSTQRRASLRFRPQRHRPLLAQPWSAAKARNIFRMDWMPFKGGWLTSRIPPVCSSYEPIK